MQFDIDGEHDVDQNVNIYIINTYTRDKRKSNISMTKKVDK